MSKPTTKKPRTNGATSRRAKATEPAAPSWMTVPQVAADLQVGERTVRRYVSEGKLPAYRVGPRHLRIRRADVENLVTVVPTVGTIRAGK